MGSKVRSVESHQLNVTPDVPVEPRKCPVCGGASRRRFLEKASLALVECTACSMVFSDFASAEFASGAFYQTAGSNFYASEEKVAGDYSNVRYTREIKLLNRYCRTGRVLDVGCSTGGFLYFLLRKHPGAYEVMGTDVATGALDFAEGKGIPVVRENFLSLAPSTPGFDAITFWAVLEHVADPGAFLQKARELLAPTGRCFVLVPNIDSLAVKLLGAKYRYILPQHLNYFSRRTLMDLGNRCGLTAIHSTTTHFNPVVLLQDWRANGDFVPDENRAKLLVRTNALKSDPLLAPLKLCYSAAERCMGSLGLADNLVLIFSPRT